MVMLNALLRRYVEGDVEGFRVRAYTYGHYLVSINSFLTSVADCKLLHDITPSHASTCLLHPKHHFDDGMLVHVELLLQPMCLCYSDQ